MLLLILEGASTRPLAPRLHEILLRHGVHGPPETILDLMGEVAGSSVAASSEVRRAAQTAQ